MNLTVNKKEYDAISFAIGQVEEEVESAIDETFIKDAKICLKHLYEIMEKYKKGKERLKRFKVIRAMVSNRNKGLSPKDIDKLTRQIISSYE